jgi:probable addiction module antidote protein
METRPFDIAEYLDSREMVAAYLEECLQDDDPRVFLVALGDVARARGMTDIARLTGLGRQSLYKAFNGQAEPRFDTVLKVLRALDIKLAVAA